MTVFDGWGIPHMSVLTAPDGSFSVVLPPGNDTLNVTTGAFVGLSQQGSVLLKELNITVSNAVGLAYNAPSVQELITIPAASVSGFVYLNTGGGSTYQSTDPLVPGAQVIFWGSDNLSKVTATTDASGSFALTNVPPGVYNYNVVYRGYNYTESPFTVTPHATTPTNATVGLTSRIGDRLRLHFRRDSSTDPRRRCARNPRGDFGTGPHQHYERDRRVHDLGLHAGELHAHRDAARHRRAFRWGSGCRSPLRAMVLVRTSLSR